MRRGVSRTSSLLGLWCLLSFGLHSYCRPLKDLQGDTFTSSELSAEVPYMSNMVPKQQPSRGSVTSSSTDGKDLSDPDRTFRIIIAVAPITAVSIVGFVALYLVVRRKLDAAIEDANSVEFNYDTLRAATNDFSLDNKIGQGGFGFVYKGRLQSGQEIAVKRLSRGSGQGEKEFINEVLIVAQLQHINLVRLLGFCFRVDERLLAYQFLPNGSLDRFIFDSTRRASLQWETRYRIIRGIVQGLIYLHEGSQWKIIHRDLKAHNILLDDNMNPKIADFGISCTQEESQSSTAEEIGTFAYMAPEYLEKGELSTKFDVYSFGMLLLEIVSGQMCTSPRVFDNGSSNGEYLLSYVWRFWNQRTPLMILDPLVEGSLSEAQVIRCIHIGLLCIQHEVDQRPTMGEILIMLSVDSLPLPSPAPAPAPSLQTTVAHHFDLLPVTEAAEVKDITEEGGSMQDAAMEHVETQSNQNAQHCLRLFCG